jgi:hypothetical protein
VFGGRRGGEGRGGGAEGEEELGLPSFQSRISSAGVPYDPRYAPKRPRNLPRRQRQQRPSSPVGREGGNGSDLERGREQRVSGAGSTH